MRKSDGLHSLDRGLEILHRLAERPCTVEDLSRLWIRAGMMPTLGHVEAALRTRPKDGSPCG